MKLLQPALDVHRLAGLVFELSSQLHIERVHRLALEEALLRAGVIDAATLEKLAGDQALHAASMRAAEESLARMMRVLTENEDERAPLRAAGRQ
jgi:hypothetical protein